MGAWGRTRDHLHGVAGGAEWRQSSKQGRDDGGDDLGPDLYSVLGVGKDIGGAELKKVYRKLALKLHPDKNPGNREAAQRFQEVSRAYNILADPQKRKYYDEHGTVEDIDVSAEDFMGMFRALMNQMMGGLSIRDMVEGMSEEELAEMPPFPFPKELFPEGTFPAGMRFSREGLQGVPPAVEALLESSPEELGKMFQEAGDRPELEEAYGGFFPDSDEDSDQYRRENSRFAGFSGMPSSSDFGGYPGGGTPFASPSNKKGKKGMGFGPNAGMPGAMPSEDQMKLTDELLKSLNLGPDADIDELTELLTALNGTEGENPMPPELMRMLGDLMGMDGMMGMADMASVGPMGFGVPPMPAPGKSGRKKGKKGKKGSGRTAVKKPRMPPQKPAPSSQSAAERQPAAMGPPPDLPQSSWTQKKVDRRDGKLWIEAAKNGALDMLFVFLEKNYGLLDFKGPGIGHTALHWCAAKGHAAACKWLLRQGAAVNSLNSEGSSPLHAAAANGQKSIVELLLESGADPTIKDEDGMSATVVAKQRKHVDAEKAIQDHLSERKTQGVCANNCKPKEMEPQEALKGSPAGLSTETEGSVSNIRSPNAIPQKEIPQETTGAVDKAEQRQAVRDELEAMEQVDDEREAQQRRQKLETAEAAAALVGVQKSEGRQWMTAAKEGKTQELKKMLEVNPNLLRYRGEGTNFSFTGHTALHWCAAKAHTDGTKLLLEEGADPNAPNNAESTPLHSAAANGSVACAKIIILGGGADATRLDGLGESAKDVALGKNQAWSQELASTIDLCSKADQLRREKPNKWSLRTMRSLLVMAGDKRVADYVEKSEIMAAVQEVLSGMVPQIIPTREVVSLKPIEEEKDNPRPEGVVQRQKDLREEGPKSPATPSQSPVAPSIAMTKSGQDPLLQKSALAKERGNTAFKNGDFLKASQQYSMAIRLDVKNHVLHSNRSAAYASMQSWDRALEDGEKCIKLAPSWGKGYARKAAALVGKGLAGDGLKVYKKGLAAEPANIACKQGIADTKVAIRRKQQEFEAATGQAFPEYNAN